MRIIQRYANGGIQNPGSQQCGCVNSRRDFLTRVLQIGGIFVQFIQNYPREFLGLLGLLCVEGVIAAGLVLALAPLADFLVDLNLAEAAHR